MKTGTTTMKLLSTLLILTGAIITSYGLKDTSWESEQIYCIGPGLIISGIVLKFWFEDLIIERIETKRTIVKIFELILLTIGMAVFSYGIKDTSWDAKEMTIVGGVLLALGYCLREWTIEKRDILISNTAKILTVIFAISVLTFLSSIYSNSEECHCENKLNDIESRIESLQ